MKVRQRAALCPSIPKSSPGSAWFCPSQSPPPPPTLPLQTNVPFTCKYTRLLHTYLPSSYTSLCIYISYIHRFLCWLPENAPFHKKQQLCQLCSEPKRAVEESLPSDCEPSSLSPLKNTPSQEPQPKAHGETNPKLKGNRILHHCLKEEEKSNHQADSVLTVRDVQH